jgi:hypothetical protein
MSTHRLTADRPGDESVAWRRYATIAAGLLVVIGLFALFAGRSVYRMQEQGSEDGRWCAFSSTIAAIKDNWLFGTGLGAFQDVFPVYRVRHKFRFIPVMVPRCSGPCQPALGRRLFAANSRRRRLFCRDHGRNRGAEATRLRASARKRRQRLVEQICRRRTMFDRRTVSAIFALMWFVGGAFAQQIVSGSIPSAAPVLAPAPEGPAAPEAIVNDDPTDSADWRARVSAARQRHADWAACVAAKEPGCTETPAPDPMDPLLNDDTLVNGDIVSTPSGLKVFRGPATVPHSLADFQ